LSAVHAAEHLKAGVHFRMISCSCEWKC